MANDPSKDEALALAVRTAIEATNVAICDAIQAGLTVDLDINDIAPSMSGGRRILHPKLSAKLSRPL